MSSPFGVQLRYWRRARRLSQLELAGRARSTSRYVSFLENGRSRPSEEMVHRLLEALDVPIRERNELLQVAGFAAKYVAHDLGAEAMNPYRASVQHILRAHEPFPALVTNRWFDVIDANSAAIRFFAQLDHRGPPRNVAEWLFEPDGPPRRLFDQWPEVAYSMLYRIRRELMAAPTDDRLQELAEMAEGRLRGVPPPEFDPETDLIVCPVINMGDVTIKLVGMVSRFGYAREITLDELRVEAIYPRDDVTEAYFRDLAEALPVRLAQSS